MKKDRIIVSSKVIKIALCVDYQICGSVQEQKEYRVIKSGEVGRIYTHRLVDLYKWSKTDWYVGEIVGR